MLHNHMGPFKRECSVYGSLRITVEFQLGVRADTDRNPVREEHFDGFVRYSCFSKGSFYANVVSMRYLMLQS